MDQDQGKTENINSPDVTQQDSEAIRKLKHDISVNIKKAFLNPPDLKSFEKCFPENRLISKENLEQIAASLYVHSFKADENHLQLLREVKLDALNLEDKILFHQLMYSVYEKNQEYTLALYESEKALESAKSLKDTNLIFHSMTAKGSMLIRLESPDIESYHRKIIEFAEKNKLDDQLSWAYHNWGSPQFNSEVQHLAPAESGGYPKFYETILQAPVVGRT